MKHRRRKNPTASLGRGVYLYRGFHIELDAPSIYSTSTGQFIPSRYYVNTGRSRYRAEDLEKARQMIDDALDP